MDISSTIVYTLYLDSGFVWSQCGLALRACGPTTSGLILSWDLSYAIYTYQSTRKPISSFSNKIKLIALVSSKDAYFKMVLKIKFTFHFKFLFLRIFVNFSKYSPWQREKLFAMLILSLNFLWAHDKQFDKLLSYLNFNE